MLLFPCCLLIASLMGVTAITPETAVLQAEKELSNFPEDPLEAYGTQRYKKVTQRSLQMSKRNALIKTALTKLESTEERLIKEVRDILTEKFRDSTSCTNARIYCASNAKYRTVDGTCNNLRNPRWGAAGSPLLRLVGARYGNPTSSTKTRGTYISRRRCARPGILPNPRRVSASFHPDLNISSSVATHLLTQMGQFLDHDLSFTPEAHVEHCCDDNSQHDCSKIMVPSDDSFFSTFSNTCLEFTRSEQFCDSSPREQFNAISSFLDASNVYGSDRETHTIVRHRNGYLLNATITKRGKELLPKHEGLYFAGDERAREMPGLASMHTLFLREHNRVARALRRAFPRLSNEIVFQEARRIVGAEMQNVVYGQYLPSILAPKFMSSRRLSLRFFSSYNPRISADISNAFATAAFRFGHSMLQGDIKRVGPGGSVSKYLLRKVFFELSNYDDRGGAGMEDILLGLIVQASQAPDRNVIDDVTNHLFNEGKPFGSDLIARNIARGRDHGLPTYGYYRRHCGLSELCNWNTRPSSIQPRSWAILKKLYSSPNDIDLFTAGLAETPVPGSVLGETFSCLIANQFQSVKFGDRYFFTHTRQSGSFRFFQKWILRTRTLGQIICDNTDIRKVRRNVFDLRSPWVRCPRSSTLKIRFFSS